jgi:adenine-specific DNA-methyltransferase
MLFLKDYLVEHLADLWTDITINLNKEGGLDLPTGKKSEEIHCIIKLAANDGDIVLDFFLGSRTRVAVAHKMGREYIGIEQLEYGENDSVVRLQNVIQSDQSGISKSVNW